MAAADTGGIARLLEAAARQGRDRLYEHECYEVLALMGAEAAPANRLVPVGALPTREILDEIPGGGLVLKVVSPDIVHKTEARGVRFAAREIGSVQETFDRMLCEVPETYAAHLEADPARVPAELRGLAGAELRRVLADRTIGVLVCSFVRPDAHGFATELFVGIRDTSEFGPIISAGLGGVEMEILARRTRPGAAVAIAPTATVDGSRFLELFRPTLSYARLSGAMRGSAPLVSDAVLIECFQAFIDVANHFSALNPEAPFHITEMEVNPFAVSGGRLAPLDGVCAFSPPVAAAGGRPIDKIEQLLRPRSLAVVGVSETSMNMGRIILNNALRAGFDRERTFVVRPGIETVDGVRCVPAIADLPEKVDLFVVAVGAAQVPEVAGQLIDHDRANAVILIPGGLGEKEGSQRLEAELRRRIADAHRSPGGGPVFLGGNSMGVESKPGRYDTTFIPEVKLPRAAEPSPAGVCILSQSGAFIITNLSRMPWLRPTYALSIGNQIDLTAGDLLRVIGADPAIGVFGVYMEGFQTGDGLAFATAVRDAVAAGKDVVFYKAGRTSEGRSATAGHTASVAGDYAVCAAALDQAGALVADDFEEFGDLLNLSVHLRGRRLAGNRLVAMSNAGFESVGMADSIRGAGGELSLARLADATAAELRRTLAEARLDSLVDVKNPLDVTPMAGDQAFTAIVGSLLDRDEVDLLVVGLVPLTPALQTLPPGSGHRESIHHRDSIARRLPELVARSRTPAVAVVDSGARFDPFAAELEGGGMPVFRNADRAVRVLRKWVDVRLRNAGRPRR